MYNNWVHSNQDHAHNTPLMHIYTLQSTSHGHCPTWIPKISYREHHSQPLSHRRFPNHSCVANTLDCISQGSIIHTTCYLLPHPWHEIVVYCSNVGYNHISQMLELQTRVVLKDCDTSDPSYDTHGNDMIEPLNMSRPTSKIYAQR